MQDLGQRCRLQLHLAARLGHGDLLGARGQAARVPAKECPGAWWATAARVDPDEPVAASSTWLLAPRPLKIGSSRMKNAPIMADKPVKP